MKTTGLALVFVLFTAPTAAQTLNPAAEIMARAAKKVQADTTYLTEHYKVTRKDELVKQEDPVPTDDPPKLKLNLVDVFCRNRYQYRLLNTIRYQDDVAYFIEFRPGKDQPKIQGTRTEKIVNDVLNNLEGVVYLRKEDYSIMAFQATLAEPAGSWYCRVNKADVKLQSKEQDGIWVPDTINLELKLRFLFLPVHRQYESTFKYHLHP